MSDQDGAPPERPAMMRFKRSYSKTRMPADQARRQGEIVTLAFALLGGRDAALNFLNSHDDGLNARPLDVASESDDGFAQVRERLENFG